MTPAAQTETGLVPDEKGHVMNLRGYAYTHPRRVTTVLSVVGYVLVIGTFLGQLPLYPSIGREMVLLLGDLIALVNTAALTAILVGWYAIKKQRVQTHRTAMLVAFGLILLFLVLYLWKVGGGALIKELHIVEGQFLWQYAAIIDPVYTAMLAIHIVLSIVAVPVVLHAVVLGLTYPVSELADTSHPRVGRIATYAWSLSLFLGIVTYWLLNHVYDWVPR